MKTSRKNRESNGSKKPVRYECRSRDVFKVTLPAAVHASDPPYTALLTHAEVDNAVCGTFVKMGWLQQDLCDGLQEVRFRAARAFGRGLTPPPTVGEMKALCARIARNYVLNVRRQEATAEEHGHVGLCEEPDVVFPLAPVFEERDPVDAERQLKVAADLFRQGRMPAHGYEILDGVAGEWSYRQLAEDLVTGFTVQGRLKSMRKRFREGLAERGMLDDYERPAVSRFACLRGLAKNRPDR